MKSFQRDLFQIRFILIKLDDLAFERKKKKKNVFTEKNDQIKNRREMALSHTLMHAPCAKQNEIYELGFVSYFFFAIVLTGIAISFTYHHACSFYQRIVLLN